MEIAITYGCQIADKILEILLRHYQPWYVGMYSNEQKYRLTCKILFQFVKKKYATDAFTKYYGLLVNQSIINCSNTLLTFVRVCS